IKGRPSADILSLLGFGGRAEMVHRDNLGGGRGTPPRRRAWARRHAGKEMRRVSSQREEVRQPGANPSPVMGNARMHPLASERPSSHGGFSQWSEKEDPGAKVGQGLSPDG